MFWLVTLLIKERKGPKIVSSATACNTLEAPIIFERLRLKIVLILRWLLIGWICTLLTKWRGWLQPGQMVSRAWTGPCTCSHCGAELTLVNGQDFWLVDTYLDHKWVRSEGTRAWRWRRSRDKLQGFLWECSFQETWDHLKCITTLLQNGQH